MDTLELNKIIAAGLVGGIAFFMTGLIGDLLVHQEPLKQAAIKIDVAPPPGAKPQDRISLVFFTNPNPDAEIRCIESCIDASHPAKYPPVSVGAYRAERFAKTAG